ncbi:MAG: hypothetical protein PVI09_18760 [Anaerolineae bacterium]|jgi:hypothetical protein
MNKGQSFLAIVVVALLVGLGLGGAGLAGSPAAAVQSYTLDWSVVAGGGNAGEQLNSTVGQTAIGWSAGGDQLGSGFWYGVGTAGYKVYLPLTVKND